MYGEMLSRMLFNDLVLSEPEGVGGTMMFVDLFLEMKVSNTDPDAGACNILIVVLGEEALDSTYSRPLRRWLCCFAIRVHWACI